MFFKCCFCNNTNKINNNRIIVNDKLNGNDGMNTHSNLHHKHRHPKYINTQKKHPNWLSLSSQLIRQREFESNWTLAACILNADCVSHRNSVEKRQSVNLVNMPLYRKHWANLFICIWMIDRLLPSRDTYLNAHTRSRTRQIDQTYSNISSDFAHRKRMGFIRKKLCNKTGENFIARDSLSFKILRKGNWRAFARVHSCWMQNLNSIATHF